MSKDRGAFEQGWKKAFEEKQMSPPEGIWDKIDSELSKEESRKYKKRIFFYKLMAAASILFALSVGLASLYDFNGTENVASTKPENKSITRGSDKNLMAEGQQDAAAKDLNAPGKREDRPDDIDKVSAEKGGDKPVETIAQKADNRSNNDAKAHNRGTLNTDKNKVANSTLATSKSTDASIPMDEQNAEKPEALGDEMIYEFMAMSYADNKGIPDERIKGNGSASVEKIPMGYDIIKDNKQQENVFLAGVNFSAGVFNPNFNSNGDYASYANGLITSDVADQGQEFRLVPLNSYESKSKNNTERELPEASVMYSYGLNLGYKLSKRIVLFSGFNYTLAQAKEQSSYIATDDNRNTYPVSTFSEVQSADNVNIKNIEGSDVINRYEFASIPVKAGYMLFDKKINLTLYTGLSPELLIGNSINVETDQPIDVNEINNSSAFNDLHLNGMLGVYIGYLIDQHYQLSIEPSYKKSLTSLVRDDNSFDSYPSYFLVSFGLAYQFK